MLPGEPDRRAQVVDMRVRQQDGSDVAGRTSQFSQRSQHVVPVAGIPGVDQQDARVVSDQNPVDRLAVSQMHVFGDGFQRRCHDRESRHGSKKDRWLN